ncbi:hypothetical protein D3C84_911380 [compost metagenome]
MAATAPGQGLQAGDQFEKGEGLAQVIVGAFAQAADPVFHALTGGEHDHRSLFARAQGTQHPIPVEARQHDVEDDHRVIAFQRQVQAFDAIGGEVDGVALFGQAAVQVVRGFFFVFDNQNAHGPPQCVVASAGAGVGR